MTSKEKERKKKLLNTWHQSRCVYLYVSPQIQGFTCCTLVQPDPVLHPLSVQCLFVYFTQRLLDNAEVLISQFLSPASTYSPSPSPPTTSLQQTRKQQWPRSWCFPKDLDIAASAPYPTPLSNTMIHQSIRHKLTCPSDMPRGMMVTLCRGMASLVK